MSSDLRMRNTKLCVGDTREWRSAGEPTELLLRCRTGSSRGGKGWKKCNPLLIISTTWWKVDVCGEKPVELTETERMLSAECTVCCVVGSGGVISLCNAEMDATLGRVGIGTSYEDPNTFEEPTGLATERVRCLAGIAQISTPCLPF